MNIEALKVYKERRPSFYKSRTALEKDKVKYQMLICAKCLTDLRPEENSVLVARDKCCVQSADLYKCPECGAEMLTGAGNPFEWKYAEMLYDRKARKSCRLFKIDTKEVIEAEAVGTE